MQNFALKILLCSLAVVGLTPITAQAYSVPEYAPAVSVRGERVVRAALTQVGVPYKYARSSPGVAFDCSGFTAYAWSTEGVSLPRNSKAQHRKVRSVSEALPGDLLFFKRPVGHVAIYIGNGEMIHAPRSGDVVSIDRVNWNKVVGIGRP